MIWFGGCTLGCAGCWNPQTHAVTVGEDIDCMVLADWVVKNAVDGVTFSGGEPMQQAPALSALVRQIATRRPELSIGMYTGYTLQELENEKWHWYYDEIKGYITGTRSLYKRIFDHLDFAVMGRYNQLQATTDKPLCGSANQNIQLFSTRHLITDFEDQYVEVTIDPADSLIQITGFPVGIHTQIDQGFNG